MVLAIYGTGGGGKDALFIAETIQKQKKRWDKIIFIDDTKNLCTFCGYDSMPYDLFKKSYGNIFTRIHVAIGETASKDILIRNIKRDGYCLEQIFHPDVIIPSSATIKDGVMIKMGVLLGENVEIGEGTRIEAYSIIRNNVKIGDSCQISAKSTIQDNVTVGKCAFIGMHSITDRNLNIGEFSIISMGAVVLHDIPRESVCMGNPGRIMKKNIEHRVFK